ncbi:oxidoreductase [Caproiciproducens sp.]|uniref:oxidoreductase n=1 Tax=Caproiciproducens sp. TaxID=1954376 RepID=UPI00289A337F|nr:FAD-dependent oxidoreductase [Caproiciproducens sp.]
MKYTKLFEKGKIGKLELKNRIVMPAMGTGFASSTGEASDEIIRYYADRAKGGCGLIITEICRIDEETGIGTSNQLCATDSKHIPRLVRLAEAVHAYDTKIFLQLHHPGNETMGRLLHGKQIVAPSPVMCRIIGEMPRELTTEEVTAMAQKFVKGAVIAKTAGFDGVEVHAAHGYLVNQFLSPHTNKRTDKYGGDFFNRMRFITEIIVGIRFACGPDFSVCVRIDGSEFIEDGLDEKECIHIARYLESLGIACLNVSCGTYESGATIIEPSCFAEGWKKHLAKNIKANVKIPVIAVNTIKHPDFAEALLEEGVSDFVGVARGQLADAEWANKAKRGEDVLIRKCIGCMNCFLVANQGRPIECTVNPILGRELTHGDDKLVKDGNGRTVAVVGGGPGGMQAALVLAKRGFKTVLFEKSDRLGGTIKFGSVPPHKELLAELIDTQEAELKKWGVDVRLNTQGTVEECRKIGACGVFLAQGGNPIVPKIPGVEKAVLAEQVLSGEVKLSGKNIAVIGGGVTGLETAEYLSPDNQVAVVEMMNAVGTTLYPSVLQYLMERLNKNKVEILTGHAIKAVGDGEITLAVTASAVEVTRKADVVVLALGVRSNRALHEEMEASFDKVVLVGDTEKPGTIVGAMHSANDKAFVF